MKNTATNVLRIAHKNGQYVTPWGHRFDTKSEVEAFQTGMEYMLCCTNSHAEFLLDKSSFTERLNDEN